ncbi:MAG: 4Fe-4S binding protein, partial [Candidatus Bathyarchaeia archaeon]
FAFFLLFNLYLSNFLFKLRLSSYTLPLPVLVSVNSPWTSSVGAIDLLQVSLSEGAIPLTVLASLFIIGALLGRIFCGWACPMGFIQDLIISARGVKPHVARTTHLTAKRFKFIILFIGLLIPISIGLSRSYSWGRDYQEALGSLSNGPLIFLSPEGALFGTAPTLVYLIQNPLPFDINVLLIVKLVILGLFFLGAYSVPWLWCRYVCPMGALMGVFARFSLLGLSRKPAKCMKCPHCVRACPTQVPILEHPFEKFNDQECVLCLECVQACPEGAIVPKFP